MSAQTLPSRVGRAVTSVSRHGVRGTGQRLRQWLIAPLAQRVYLREEHLWLTVPNVPGGEAMPDGYVFRPGTADDLAPLVAIGGIPPARARRYLDQGARFYVATHGDELAFATWIHTGSVPVLAASGGAMALPDGVVSFEDSIAAPGHRRSGVALAVVNHVSWLEHERGARTIITRVNVENVPARRWSEKMGCVVVATIRLRRIGPWQRVTVEPAPGGEQIAALLAERL